MENILLTSDFLITLINHTRKNKMAVLKLKIKLVGQQFRDFWPLKATDIGL